jgi:hypothetical protein
MGPTNRCGEKQRRSADKISISHIQSVLLQDSPKSDVRQARTPKAHNSDAFASRELLCINGCGIALRFAEFDPNLGDSYTGNAVFLREALVVQLLQGQAFCQMQIANQAFKAAEGYLALRASDHSFIHKQRAVPRYLHPEHTCF